MALKSTDTMPKYTVDADEETGLWISEPQYVGEVNAWDWFAKKDNIRWHFDTYEAVSLEGPETRAIAVRWVK